MVFIIPGIGLVVVVLWLSSRYENPLIELPSHLELVIGDVVALRYQLSIVAKWLVSHSLARASCYRSCAHGISGECISHFRITFVVRFESFRRARFPDRQEDVGVDRVVFRGSCFTVVRRSRLLN